MKINCLDYFMREKIEFYSSILSKRELPFDEFERLILEEMRKVVGDKMSILHISANLLTPWYEIVCRYAALYRLNRKELV